MYLKKNDAFTFQEPLLKTPDHTILPELDASTSVIEDALIGGSIVHSDIQLAARERKLE